MIVQVMLLSDCWARQLIRTPMIIMNARFSSFPSYHGFSTLIYAALVYKVFTLIMCVAKIYVVHLLFYSSVDAVNRIYEIKGRKLTSPLAICVGKVSDICRFAVTENLPNDLLESLLPGPVTVVLLRGQFHTTNSHPCSCLWKKY